MKLLNDSGSHTHIHRKVDVYVEITSREMADVFWSWDAQQQIEFFAHLRQISTPFALDCQICAMVTEAVHQAVEHKNTDAFEALETIHSFFVQNTKEKDNGL